MAADFNVAVTDHARWRAAERFAWFDTSTIEEEVRGALRVGRVSAEREHLGLRRTLNESSLFAWTEDGERVYALRHDADAFVVMTTMKPPGRSDSMSGPSKNPTGRRAP